MRGRSGDNRGTMCCGRAKGVSEEVVSRGALVSRIWGRLRAILKIARAK